MYEFIHAQGALIGLPHPISAEQEAITHPNVAWMDAWLDIALITYGGIEGVALAALPSHLGELRDRKSVV